MHKNAVLCYSSFHSWIVPFVRKFYPILNQDILSYNFYPVSLSLLFEIRIILSLLRTNPVVRTDSGMQNEKCPEQQARVYKQFFNNKNRN
jgi:hypothetical protein